MSQLAYRLDSGLLHSANTSSFIAIFRRVKISRRVNNVGVLYPRHSDNEWPCKVIWINHITRSLFYSFCTNIQTSWVFPSYLLYFTKLVVTYVEMPYFATRLELCFRNIFVTTFIKNASNSIDINLWLVYILIKKTTTVTSTKWWYIQLMLVIIDLSHPTSLWNNGH